MSGPSVRFRLGIHFALRLFEIALLYGHYVGAITFAGDLLLKFMPQLQMHPGLFALPLYFIIVLLVASYTFVFIWEMKVAGLPRVPQPSRFFDLSRKGLRWFLMAGIVVCACSFAFFASLSIKAFLAQPQSTSASLLNLVNNVSVSIFVLASLIVYHLTWLRRMQDPSVSVFATVPAMIVHLLPNQGAPRDSLKAAIRKDSINRIIVAWTLGFAIVLLGVSYAQAFFPDQAGGLIPQLVVGLVFWALISSLVTVFFVRASRRELGIIDGTYTSVGRGKFETWLFTGVFAAGFLLALICYCTNTFRIVATLVLANMSYLTFALIIVSWPAMLFYAALMMDVLLIHARNHHEDQSVCTRTPVFLSMGMEYNILSPGDTSLAYDADF